MDTKPLCPSCGKPLDASAPKGLCPECLMKGAFPTGTGTDSGGKSPRFVPPTIEELARHFPQLEIIEFIGQGGMGAVYQARQKQLDRIVALKILPPQVASGPGFAERFTREARALAKLNHPHIVTLYEFGQADGLFYFLMEFVDGLNLRQLLNASRIAPKEALAIVPQICDALQFAHERGIVHRDIKPENILLSREGWVKIADFGVAKMLGGSDPLAPSDGEKVAQPGAGPSLTGGQIIGTPRYMAPEQVAHPLEVDHRADIYSLGVVFYQMLTGELPTGKFEAPSKKVVIDVRLDEVVLRALEKQPELRYQQVSEVKTILETIASTAGDPPPDKSGMIRIIEVLFDVTFTTSLAVKLFNLSALGFFGSLGFLGYVPLAGWHWCLGFFGLYGLFGLIGLAFIVEPAKRQQAKQAPDAAPSAASGKGKSGHEPPETTPGKETRGSRFNSLFASPEVREIGAHLTGAEELRMKKFGGVFGWWNAATFFLPMACVWFFPIPVPLNWIIASVVLMLGLAFYPLWWKKRAALLCDTAWAKEHGYNPETIRIFPFGSTGIMLLGVVLLLMQAALWWQIYEPAGVWLPYLSQSSIPGQDGELLFRVTGVSQRKQIVLVRIACEPALNRYQLLAADSGPGFELRDDATNGMPPVDCLIAPDANNGIGKALVGSNGFSGKPDYLIGFVLADEQAAARAVEQVRRYYLVNSNGLTKGHDYLPLFSLRRRLGKDASGKPVFEQIWCSFMLDAKSPTQKPIAGNLSFGPAIERVLPGDDSDPTDLLDLDSGNIVKAVSSDTPAPSPPAGIFFSLPLSQLIASANLALKPIESGDWDSLTAPAASMAIAKLEFTTAGRRDYVPFDQFPKTIVFKTRAGRMGILQITGLSDNPPGVNIRYKLVQNIEGAAAKRQRFEPREGLADKTSWGVENKSEVNPDGWAVTASMSLGGVARIQSSMIRGKSAAPGGPPGENDDVCRITLAGGTDDEVTLNIEDLKAANTLRLKLKRDEWTGILVNGVNYNIGYAAVWVSPDQPDTTPFARIILTHSDHLAFDPVIERTVTLGEANPDGLVFVNLEKGEVMGSPFSLPVNPSDPGIFERNARIDEWIEISGVDLAIHLKPANWGFVPLDMRMIYHRDGNESPDYFDQLSPDDVRSVIKAPESHKDYVVSLGGGVSAYPVSASYIFKTRLGTLGVLNITGVTDNPPGVKVRYKLIR